MFAARMAPLAAGRVAPWIFAASLIDACASAQPTRECSRAPDARGAGRAYGTASPAQTDDSGPTAPHPEDEAKAAELSDLSATISETSPRFSPNGRLVAFVGNRDGRSLYVQDLGAAAEPRRIPVNLPKRFRRPQFSPDGEFIYFTTDEDGDEAFSIDRIELSSGALEEVTARDKRRHDGPFFAKRGAMADRFLFTCRSPDQRGLSLFEQSAQPGAAAVKVYENADRYLAAVRFDLRQVVVGELGQGRALWVVDLEAAKAGEVPMASEPRQLYPPGDLAAKGARIHDVEYAPDGDRVLVATDDGGEATHVLALDAGTGRELGRFTEGRMPGGDVQGMVAAGDSIAFIVDLGTHHELRVLDARTLVRRPGASLGLGSEVPGSSHPNNTSGLAISPDGRHLAVQWSTPWSAPRIQIVDTHTGESGPLTNAPKAVGPEMDVRVVGIRSFDGLEIPTLVYRSNDDVKHPVVMQIHGGFAYAASARFDPWNSLLVANGYAVVEPNVRGSGGFGRAFERADDGIDKLNAVRDHGAVGRWIAAQPWADASRMAVTGRSAGGYYTLMALASYPELWHAGIAIVPTYDLARDIAAMDSDLRHYLETREFVPLTETGAIAALSPSTYVDRIRAPLFVYAGARDVRSTVEQIDRLVRDLRARGRTVEYMREARAGHSEDATLVSIQRARMLRFLRDALQN